MSLSPAELDPATASRRRWRPRWSLRGRPRTVFLQAGAAWSYELAGESIPKRLAPASSWPTAHAGGSVRLVLSGALTHQLVVDDAALPLADAQAVVGWARHQFTHYHGPAAQRWAIAPWHSAGQRGASAAHGVDLDAMLGAAREHKLQLRAVQPWWAVALRAATQEVPTLALAARAELWLVEALQATRVCCTAGRVERIETHWLAQADEAALAELIGSVEHDDSSRCVLGYGVAVSPGITLAARCLGTLDGECPDRRWLVA